MNLTNLLLVGSSRPERLRQSENGPAPERAEISFLEAIRGEADCLQLRAQQRLPLPPAEKIIVLREGMLAVDAMPAKGKLQVLDFLVPGDVISASTVLSTPGISLRAITRASLVSLDLPKADSTRPVQDYWAFLVVQCWNQLARVNIHQLMIGRLETEPRIASFILSLALRSHQTGADRPTVVLPMSRTDIANYLVINCDTLSRTMMRLCEAGIIERISRHAIRVVDLDALRRRSPLAPMLSALLERNCKQANGAEARLKRSASGPALPDEHLTIRSAAGIGPPSLATAGYRLSANEVGF
jgi:CRP/FNR family transcriptional regulator, anaerobic regulatory protein